MRESNRYYDGLIVAARQPTYGQRRAAMALAEREIDRMSKPNQLSGPLSADWPVALFMSALTSAQTRWETARAQRRLTVVALALGAFKMDHGAYPATLAELTPKDLKMVPLDPFSDKPFIYHPAAADYSLYSVGPNMIDDGGASAGAKAGDDIVANEPS